MEVIDVKAAKEYVMGNYPNDPLLKHIAVSLLDQLPKVDTVEVVRCKDCKWRNTRGCPYMNFNATVRDDSDYCSDGERKKDHE